MNREILFKAKRIDWKNLPKEEWWVEGDVQHTTSKNIILIVDVDDDKGYPCDSSTLCQYTGLNDKNDKKIWENDIVKCPKRKEGYQLYQVVWRNEFADFGVEPIKPKYGVKYPIGLSDATTLHGYNYRALGSIFDNPELLEVE